MFKIESYVAPILLSYVDKYVRDFKSVDAQLSLWTGGVALYNLVLKADVLQQELALPFTLVSGRIHELLIHVPWTKIMSEPIVVTIDTIECVLGSQPESSSSEESVPDSPSKKTPVQAPPGYMQALVRRVVSNISLRVHHLIVKYVQDDIVMSLNVKHLAVDSAGPNWEPLFADIDQVQPVIRRLVRLDDLTLCLDRTDADGKIRFYQEPLLYRCQLNFRVLTRLVSANTRRASSISIQLRSSNLAWGVTGDQLTMLIRLVRERAVHNTTPPAPPAKATEAQTAPLHAQSQNTAEPAQSESWSEWAWSWLPTLVDREGGSLPPAPPTPVPIHFAAYFDEVSITFKVMETDSNNRRRARGVLEFNATQTAFKSFVCSPTTLRMRAGWRSFTLSSRGKCVCGHMDYNALQEEPTFYLCKKQSQGPEDDWTWPDEDELNQVVETAQAVDEQYRISPDLYQPLPLPKQSSASGYPDVGQPESPNPGRKPDEPKESGAQFWTQMAPQFFVEYIHERAPPQIEANPYENPPIDFQYSDWVEECEIKVRLELMEVRVCMGLIHRLSAVYAIFQELPLVPMPELPRRVLTVEECEALTDNLPQRRISVEILGLHIVVHPWEHPLFQRPSLPSLVLDLNLPNINVAATAPLYPHRVCVAACQMPEDVGSLWQGSRLHVTVKVESIEAKISSFNDDVKARPCFRTDLKAVFHILLNKEYFSRGESVQLAYSVRIREANLSGSVARLQAAWQVPKSLWMQQVSAALNYTTLAADALNDEESVAIDLTFEDLLVRGYQTYNTTTNIVTLQTTKATALHEPKGSELKQAWLFSAPDSHTNIPCLRIAVQWCKHSAPHSLEYLGIYTEPAAIAVDPLFIAWLAYRPTLRPAEMASTSGSMKSVSSQYFLRRRTTGTSSSGRGGTRSSGAEVHMRRSVGSSDKEQSRVDPRIVKKPKSALESFLSGQKLLELHERLQRMLVNVQIGLTTVYVTMTTASALDCATVRDAMERHASLSQDVLGFSLGHLTVFSNALSKQFWNEIRHDGPTFVVPKAQQNPIRDSFPWKLKLADVTFYTLDMVTPPVDKVDQASFQPRRSQLRNFGLAKPRTVLELVTTKVTLSVVTKQVQIKHIAKTEAPKKEKEATPEEKKVKYFTGGMSFKPTTLKEFIRGPAKRKKDKSPEFQPEKPEQESVQIKKGPVVSLGIHFHADTPPLIFRLEQDQVHMVAAALHCFTHIKVLLTRPPLYIPRANQTMGASSRSVIRSVSDMEQLQTPSEESASSKSELIPIFESFSAKDLSMDIKTFVWFQWVVSRVTIVATTQQSKLALDVDDIITSLDLQTHYNQLKIKVASASVKHYTRTREDEWTAGVLGGRVLEAREPTNAKEESHFMAITVTQAQISNLPASWKEELHPKLLEHKRDSDTMWEIYATLAPLEAVIQPTILNQIVSLFLEMAPRSFCPLAKEKEAGRSDVRWPFCYVTAGGLRLLLTVRDEETKNDEDDTFVFVIGKVTVNPHPDNPICRRPINAAMEAGWLNTGGALDGNQYELTIRNVGIRCAQFHQLVSHESSEAEMKGTASENPAFKWTQKIVMPVFTPILHSVDISCVLAPALYTNGLLTCGPAVELNLVSDCTIEISVDQVVMAQQFMYNLANAYKERQAQNLLFNQELLHVCPYATLLMGPSETDDKYNYDSGANNSADDLKNTSEACRGADSGIDFAPGITTQGTCADSAPSLLKKSVSVGFVDQWSDPAEFLELFVTMGTIELTLYTVDDSTPEVVPLRPPVKWKMSPVAEPLVQLVVREETGSQSGSVDDESSIALTRESPASFSPSGKSLSEKIRQADIGKTKLEYCQNLPHVRHAEGNIPLIHATLKQPNLYYWRKTSQKSFQVSLFDAWIGLGGGQSANFWHAALLTTERGAADPATDIPPALATMKIVSSSATAPGNAPVRGSIRLDIERPVMIEVSLDRLERLKAINYLMKDRLLPSLAQNSSFLDKDEAITEEVSLLYRLQTSLVQHSIESVTVQTTQMGISGSQGAAGWDSLSVQVAAGGRPERLVGRALLTAAVVTAGPASDSRHIVMHPVTIGTELEASWEAWRRVEDRLSARDPTVRMCLDVDCVDLDLRPEELNVITRIQDVLRIIMATEDEDQVDRKSSWCTELQSEATQSRVAFGGRSSFSSTDTPGEEHFYKDDLRSGAFKIVSGGQLPMAYQVTYNNNSVSWRYPHPRAISRLVIFPLPERDEETPCVLELYIPILGRWEAHTRFSVPVGEPREMQLYMPSPESIYAQMWRYRVMEYEEQPPPFQFDINRFMPRNDPMAYQHFPNAPLSAPSCGVTAEQLSGVVRVDSCFSPRLAPRVRLAVRLASLSVYVHNALPSLTSQGTTLEGYYVSKPLWRAHRVLCARARSSTLHVRLGSPAGALVLFDANLSSDVVECSTGTMEQLVEEFQFRCGLSLPIGALSRARVALSRVNISLHVPRLRTLRALVDDWHAVILSHEHKVYEEEEVLDKPKLSYLQRRDANETALEGRLSLWIHNSSAVALRVGQEGTEEVVPLGPGARLAYRWRSPTAPKKLRFALVGPSTDWHWSTSIPFTIEHFRIKMYDAEALGSSKSTPGGSVSLYTSVEERGSRLCMRLAGRLCLANMLRFNLLYKVRARFNDSNQWRTVCSSELNAETVGRTVICAADNEMTVKIKFVGDIGWSGEIPLKECPKENVPWLVKVPCKGDLPYMSVWTRVIRARSDGRIFATVWPLYVLYSHLPLDTDVLIMSESGSDTKESLPLVQAAPGRGASTHLLAPGTTAARHSLSFQYRNIDCPVTKEAVPLHYGMTDTSVFDKRSTVSTIEEVFAETMQWLERTERGAFSGWPYSIVTRHWPGKWKPALLQPRCDVTVQYKPVRVGGGCSLEVQLRPVVILCNAAPIALTLRAHDAAPLCKLEPGTAVSPPSSVLTKPFFISVEMGRETFVSGELSVTSAELGRYGAPAPGRIALDRPTDMAIQCNHKVALLTMYYEIKEEISVLGMTSTYMLINRLDSDILISAQAVPNEDEEHMVLRPTTYKTVRPTAPTCVFGRSLCKFWVATRMWRGSDPAELRLYLCVSLPGSATTTRAAPVRLGQPPLRRPIALTDKTSTSVPVVVTQVKHEGRWLVTVAPDPCPQLLVHNNTRATIAVAQPATSADEPSTSRFVIRTECPGTTWYCVIRPGGVKYYSTPSHCLRFPPPVSGTPAPSVLFLTFARIQDGLEPEWCAPVAAADGEQLLQLADGETIKMRLRTHPHSTHLELRDVDQHDISASDIRNRLIGAFSSVEAMWDTKSSNAASLKRTDADERLLEPLLPEVSSGSVTSPVVSPTLASSPAEDKTTNATQDIQLEGGKGRTTEKEDASTVLLFPTNRDSIDVDQLSRAALQTNSIDSAKTTAYPEVCDDEWNETASWRACDRLRLIATSISIHLASRADTQPLVALHLERAGVFVKTDTRRTKTTISIADVQVDNLQHENGLFDFSVVCSTRGALPAEEPWPTLWHVFAERRAFATRVATARVCLRLTHDTWLSATQAHTELTEVDMVAGRLALYVEDAYVTALAGLVRAVTDPRNLPHAALAAERALRAPLRLRTLHVQPLHVTLTLHTAARIYIALDQSPLHLSAFKMHDLMTSTERLTHALTVHYLSAAILGAGWVVGGLELLGAPGALAARVGGATGGVKGVASAAAAALLRSLSAWASSLARNLDLLAGDEEHAKRAAAARRRPPQSFMAGLATGITNFAINILGAVGGLAHHPVVGVAVGETESGATALRRGLIGAFAKPLSATADLVAYAGQGLLTQTGWDPVPQPRRLWTSAESDSGWQRDCVRWMFRLAELSALAGYQVLMDGAPVQLLFTHKFLVLAQPDTERILEMIDFRFISVGPYQGHIIELHVTQRRQSKMFDTKTVNEDDDVQISAAAMARVARYTGAEAGPSTAPDTRVLVLLPAPGLALALHAALRACSHHNSDAYFPLL